MAAPPNQVPSDTAHPPAIEEQLDFVFALLPRIRDRTTWWGGGARRGKYGLSRSTLTVGLQDMRGGRARV